LRMAAGGWRLAGHQNEDHACPQDLPSSVAAGAPPNCCRQIRT
jgi:hypothetical protein